MRAFRVRSVVESDADNRKECAMRKACWKRLGIAAMGVLALIACPSASLAGDGLVALTTAAASCGNDTSAIYVGCGNGTLTDNRSGLTWLANANCWGLQADWYEAMETVRRVGMR